MLFYLILCILLGILLNIFIQVQYAFVISLSLFIIFLFINKYRIEKISKRSVYLYIMYRKKGLNHDDALNSMVKFAYSDNEQAYVLVSNYAVFSKKDPFNNFGKELNSLDNLCAVIVYMYSLQFQIKPDDIRFKQKIVKIIEKNINKGIRNNPNMVL